MPVLMPPNEHDRLVAVRDAAQALHSADLQPLRNVVRTAARALQAQRAAFTVVERDAVRLLVTHECGEERVPRDQFFCATAILQSGPFVVFDASRDPRFQRMERVADGPHIRFYAGVPVRGLSGDIVGTLCVFDGAARDGFADADRETLVQLAGTLEREMHALERGGQTRRPWEHNWERDATELLGHEHVLAPPPETPPGSARVRQSTPQSGGEVPRVVPPSRMHPSELAGVAIDDATPMHDISEAAQNATSAVAAHLHQNPRLLQQFIDSNPNPVFIKDTDDHFVMVNEAGASLFGRSADQMIGLAEADVSLPTGKASSFTGEFARVTTAVPEAITAHDPREEHFIDYEGKSRWFVVRRAPLCANDAEYVLTIATEITAIKAAHRRERDRRVLTRVVSGPQSLEHALRALAAFVETHIRNVHCFVWSRDKDALTYHHAGTAPEDLVASVERTPVSPDKVPRECDSTQKGPIYEGTIAGNAYAAPYLGAKNRAELRLSSFVIHGPAGEAIGAIDVLARMDAPLDDDAVETCTAATDLAAIAVEQRRRQSTISFQTQYDALTKLPNRFEFQSRLRRAIGNAKRNGHRLAVLHLDVDRFAKVNDTLGHAGGDALLRDLADRLDRTLREGDTIARTGGDEFCVLLPDASDAADATRVAKKIQDVLDRPFDIVGYSLVVNVTIGVSIYPEDGGDANTVLRAADAALNRSKESAPGGFCFFAPDMHSEAVQRLKLESALREAVERNKLHMALQPQVDLSTGETVGFEALARWNHDEMGPISPGQFIPLAEEIHLISDIGIWAIEEVCRAARYWYEYDGPPMSFGVNVSPHQLARPGFVDEVRRAIEYYRIPAGTLECEITETAMMKDVEAVAPKLAALRALGVRISIDDFGAGYTSLQYLRFLPIDRVKIDRSFIADLKGAPDDPDRAAACVRALIEMPHIMGFDVVAEGVETLAQANFLRELHCEVAQGFLFGRPDEALVSMNHALRGLGRSV